MKTCQMWVEKLLAIQPIRMKQAAMGNMARGPKRSRNRPNKGATKAPTKPEAEKMAAVRARLLRK